jgi:hypothetical protein
MLTRILQKYKRPLQATAILTAVFVLWQATGQPQAEAQTEMGFWRTIFNIAAWIGENTIGRFR